MEGKVMSEIPTIQVHWPGKGKEIFRINESDFDPEIHKRLTEKEEAKAEAAAEEPAEPKGKGKK
jgi:hypothetical protein